MDAPLILGIDPGTRVVGYGFVTRRQRTIKAMEHGEIDVEDRENPEHLMTIYGEITELLEAHAPDVVSVEKAFYGPNAKASMKLGEARGTLLLAISQAGPELKEYTPSQIKKAVTGNGSASKKQVQEMIQAILNLDSASLSSHVSDALATAICYVHRRS